MSASIVTLTRIIESVKDALRDDLVSAGELRQVAAYLLPDNALSIDDFEQIICGVIGEGIAIGEASNVNGNYVKFTAWAGSPLELSKRAICAFNSCEVSDREFAFWLCLASNVDEHEKDEPSD